MAAKDTKKGQRTLLAVPDESELILKWTNQILNQGVSLKAILREIRRERKAAQIRMHSAATLMKKTLPGECGRFATA